MSHELNNALVQATCAVLNGAFAWEERRGQDTFEVEKLDSWPTFLSLLKHGARIDRDTPLDEEGRTLLGMLEWNTYCIWNDDALTDYNLIAYEKASRAVLAQLVEHGFVVQPEDVTEHTHLKTSDFIDLEVLAARSKERLLQETLPDEPQRVSKPRL